jgi:hypothetical protein
VREAAPAAERVRILLLRGDRLLGSTAPERLERALEAFAEAQEVAADPSVDGDLRELAERRIEETRWLIGQRSG